MAQIRGIPGAVDDVGVEYQNLIEDDRAFMWDALGRRQGVLHGLGMTLDPGVLTVTFAPGAALVEERGATIVGRGRGYHVFTDDAATVVLDAPDASARVDALVVCWADPQYGILGPAVTAPGPQIVAVKGVSGTTTPRTDDQINTAIGPGGWFRYADVRINPGDVEVNPANVTLSTAAVSSGRPWRESSGSVTLTGNGTLDATESIVFPVGLFTVPPLIFFSVSNINFNASWTNPTKDSMTLTVRRMDYATWTGSVQVHWRAEQKTPTSAGG